jgi:hypothetical protein
VQVSPRFLFAHIPDSGSSLAPGPDVFHVEDMQVPVTMPIGEMKLRVYSPEGPGPFPVHLNFHGGKIDVSICAISIKLNGVQEAGCSADSRVKPLGADTCATKPTSKSST